MEAEKWGFAWKNAGQAGNYFAAGEPLLTPGRKCHDSRVTRSRSLTRWQAKRRGSARQRGERKADGRIGGRKMGDLNNKATKER